MAASKLRAFQDAMRNQGWRIAWIPHDDHSQPLRYSTNWLALVGAAGFVGGIVLTVFQVRQQQPGQGTLWGLALSVISLAFMFFALWWQARQVRSGWREVVARCVDIERRKVLHRGKAAWDARLLCEFEFQGRPYRATPVVHYRTFQTESGLDRYLATQLTDDATCRLHVNPANPLECELLGQGLKESVLYNT